MTTTYLAFGGTINYSPGNPASFQPFTQSGSPSITGSGFSVEAEAQVTWQQAGTFSNLVVFNGQSTINTTSTTIVHRTGGVTGNQTVTITTTGKTTDGTHTDSVSAGNLVNVQVSPAASGGSNMSARSIGENFAPTITTNTCSTQGSFGNVISSVVAGTSYYNALSSIMRKQTTEANAQVQFNAACTLQNLGVYVSANTATTATAKSRIGGANGNLVASISSGTTGQIQDTTHTDSISSGNLVNTSFGSSSGTVITIWNIACDVISTGYNALYYGSDASGVPINSTTENHVTLMGGINSSTAAVAFSTNTAYTASQFQTNALSNTSTGQTNCFVDTGGSHGNGTTVYASTTAGLVTDGTHTDVIGSSTTTGYDWNTTTANQPVFSNVGIIAGYPAPVTVLNWFPTYDSRVNPFLQAIQNTYAVNTIQPFPITQNKFYPAYEAQVKPRPPTSQYTLSVIPIIPTPPTILQWLPDYSAEVKLSPDRFPYSIIGWNVPAIAQAVTINSWYPDFDATVEPFLTRIQGSVFTQSPLNSISQNNYYPIYDPQVKPFAKASQYSIFAELLASPISITNWYPVYDPKVKPFLTTAQYTYYTRLLSLAIPALNWFPTYDSIVKPVALTAQFSAIAQVLPLPISILRWLPDYSAEVKIGPLTAKFNVIAGPPLASINQTDWYPDYDSQVKANPLASKFSYLAQTLATPIVRNAWYPNYPVEVKQFISTIQSIATIPPIVIVTPSGAVQIIWEIDGDVFSMLFS